VGKGQHSEATDQGRGPGVMADRNGWCGRQPFDHRQHRNSPPSVSSAKQQGQGPKWAVVPEQSPG